MNEEAVRIGPLNEGATFVPGGVAVRPSDQQIFVWINRMFSDPSTPTSLGVLGTVFPNTGVTLTRGNAKLELGALAFAPDGTLYGLLDDLWQIEVESGVAEKIGSFNGEFRIVGADFHPDLGLLFGLSDRNELVSIDPISGHVKALSRLSEDVGQVGSAVFVPGSETLIASAERNGTGIRFEIDIRTGQVSGVAALSDGQVRLGLGYALDLGACDAPENPTVSQIKFRANCGGSATAGPVEARWGDIYGSGSTLEADSGERLELTCYGGSFYSLTYTYAPGMTPVLVGKCPFREGCNTGFFIASGDENANSKPDCLLGTRWISKDYGTNDIPNPWTGEQSENPPALDWAEWVFTRAPPSLSRGRVLRFSHKYAYGKEPPLECGTPQLFEGPPIRPTKELPGRGTGTADLGGGIGARRMAISEAETPMQPDPFLACDLNRSGACDAVDRAQFVEAIGTCRPHLGYRPAYDADGDGCVTLADQDALFR
jgi:hypothetical protein